MTRPIVLGAMFRALGAYPSGWRHAGAHRDPRADATVLRRTAKLAEAAGLDFLYFGEWLSTGLDLEHRDPYLLARVDPLSAVTFAAGITRRIGLVGTINASYSGPYATARATASSDVLSSGRVAIGLAVSSDTGADANFGVAPVPADRRFEHAEEFVDALRSLWDSWDDDAFVADRSTGRLIDAEGLHATDFDGDFVHVAGPLNAPRPPQGHPPIIHAGSSAASLRFAGRNADVALVAIGAPSEGVAIRREIAEHALAAGRAAEDVLLVAPIMPIVADTVPESWAIFDELVRLLPVGDDNAGGALPSARSLRSLAQVIDTPLTNVELDEPVTRRAAARFNEYGQQLLALVAARTGRSLETGDRAITYRHVLATHAVPAPVIVGDASSVADHFEEWVDLGAVDGFVVQSPFLPAPFAAFTELVVPELVRRGRFRSGYEGRTLREHLGLGRPENTHRVPLVRTAAQRFAGFDEVVGAS
ncbi:NtaA/DmoA family FMN-dependent monooxygenase [Agromyces atrinae]|uniref:FMN-dependent oxidoreductase (Nitrilotriacetate monooxygenase family) n=2 Tax=Agromyces atrinae TaxID=592376 RepID=A0A852SHX4_9MICO|nr:NtaA/DmoA family FMN-dependent monooxygenase [Agromyces atrinae]NYD68753.1 FMN-dependent oxidoreductase (nitrilotriacetate monooxygenase family) [Agromyces atrinae]